MLYYLFVLYKRGTWPMVVAMSLKDLKKRLNPAAKRMGHYTAYTLSDAEYVGSVSNLQGETKDALPAYETPPSIAGVTLSAAKLHPESGKVHDVTLRRMDFMNPRWQWHIHVWHKDGFSEIYSHYEMRPDMQPIAGEDTGEMLGRLMIHYRPAYGEDYYQGRHDTLVGNLVNR